jgi:hypothetical protein
LDPLRYKGFEASYLALLLLIPVDREGLLERAHLADEGFKLLKVSKIDMGFFFKISLFEKNPGFFSKAMLGKKSHVDMRCPMLTPMSTWDFFQNAMLT